MQIIFINLNLILVCLKNADFLQKGNHVCNGLGSLYLRTNIAVLLLVLRIAGQIMAYSIGVPSWKLWQGKSIYYVFVGNKSSIKIPQIFGIILQSTLQIVTGGTLFGEDFGPSDRISINWEQFNVFSILLQRLVQIEHK